MSSTQLSPFCCSSVADDDDSNDGWQVKTQNRSLSLGNMQTSRSWLAGHREEPNRWEMARADVGGMGQWRVNR